MPAWQKPPDDGGSSDPERDEELAELRGLKDDAGEFLAIAQEWCEDWKMRPKEELGDQVDDEIRDTMEDYCRLLVPFFKNSHSLRQLKRLAGQELIPENAVPSQERTSLTEYQAHRALLTVLGTLRHRLGTLPARASGARVITVKVARRRRTDRRKT